MGCSSYVLFPHLPNDADNYKQQSKNKDKECRPVNSDGQGM